MPTHVTATHQIDERYEGGWLCPTESHRIRLTEMSPAVRRSRMLSGLFAGIGVVVMGPWIGWWPLALFAAVPAPLLLLDPLLVRARRPERLGAAAIMFHTGGVLGGVGVNGGVDRALLPRGALPPGPAAAPLPPA